MLSVPVRNGNVKTLRDPQTREVEIVIFPIATCCSFSSELGSDSSSCGRRQLDEEVITIPSGSEADEEVVGSRSKKRSSVPF